MLTIETDTHSRGTPERPQVLLFLRYGMRPAQELWLAGHTRESALAEAHRRFPEEEFCFRPPTTPNRRFCDGDNMEN